MSKIASKHCGGIYIADVNCFDEYPKLKQAFEAMRPGRIEEILNHLKNNDPSYSDIIARRAKQSMILRGRLTDGVSDFEQYTDTVYEQALYELDAVYSAAFHDAVALLKDLGILL